jgi:protein-tyrosine kinase
MSLIERAVERISPPPPGGPTPLPTPNGAGAGTTPQSTVEAAMEALAASGTPVAPAAALAPPATQAPTRPSPSSVPQGSPTIVIDVDRLRERGFITPDGPVTELSQQFRVIKRPLIGNAFGRGTTVVPRGKRVMVTSAMPGEGKSFCAVNLAMSVAAERDHQVLLVDADVARPSLPDVLGIETGAGLMDWLVDGSVDVEQLVRQTNIDKLAILPAGRGHPQATEYIASDAMTRLLDVLTERYPDRLIVFDSPPLLVTTEARVLASHMGQIVMVVEAGRTSRETVKAAIETIDGCEVVGLLLNKAEADRPGGSYGYGYSAYGSKAGRR